MLLIERAAKLHTKLAMVEYHQWSSNWSRAQEGKELVDYNNKTSTSQIWNWGMKRWGLEFSKAEYEARNKPLEA